MNVNKVFSYQPQFEEFVAAGPEPSLADVVFQYYNSHFDDDTAVRYTERYMACFERMTDILN